MSDELLEMQKDTFKGLLLVTWLISLAGLWVALYSTIYLPSQQIGLGAIFWFGITPLTLGMRRLMERNFRLATWLWVCAFVGLVVVAVPWTSAPNFGFAPYAFILMVVVSGLLISREATLYIGGLATLLSLIALAVTGHLLDLEALSSIFPPLAMMWVTAVLGWVSSDQLVTALQWTRTAQMEANIQAENLRQSRDALEKSLLIRDNLNAQLQEAHQQVMRRARQLEAAGEVSRRISSLLDLEQLLIQVTNLICDKFGYYYAAVFLMDEREQALVLRAAGGERGPAMMQRGLQLAVDSTSINGYAASSGRVVCINDVTMSRYYQRDDLLRETISELAIPLYIGQQMVGTLDVQSTEVNAFSQDDVAALEGLAAQVAIAIQNTRLYESEQARRQVAETLREVGRILGSTLDLDEVLDRLLEQLAQVVPYSRAAVMLQSGETLCMAAARGYGDLQRALEISVDIRQDDVFSKISRERQALVIADVDQFEGWKQQPWLPLDHSWVGAPLIAQDNVIGMLSLTRPERNAFSQDEATVVLTFANQAAIAIQNARLYEQVREFNQQLEQKVQERTAELERAYRLLEQLDRNKSTFISIAAHELRTPLTVMKGYTEMMQRDAAVAASPFLTETLKGILTGTARLYEIINSMLDVARIDSQVLDLRPELVHVAPIIHRVQREFAEALDERRLTLRVQDIDHLPQLMADPDMLYKVFYHVIVNAIKYTPDGGYIEVNGQLFRDEKLGDSIEISVRDTGIGIDPEHQELIFEKFYQTGKVALHSSGKTKFKGGGPGLGLAIARGIVQAHGGRIWAESPGHNEETCPGSTFHILLPLAGVKPRPKILP